MRFVAPAHCFLRGAAGCLHPPQQFIAFPSDLLALAGDFFPLALSIATFAQNGGELGLRACALRLRIPQRAPLPLELLHRGVALADEGGDFDEVRAQLVVLPPCDGELLGHAVALFLRRPELGARVAGTRLQTLDQAADFPGRIERIPDTSGRQIDHSRGHAPVLRHRQTAEVNFTDIRFWLGHALSLGTATPTAVWRDYEARDVPETAADWRSGLPPGGNNRAAAQTPPFVLTGWSETLKSEKR